ncbi:hypothetical protein V5738_17865 [Salinisphaera sp. SPP-AMP-43]|uniref:hypothetical protein n=1 Tax=Salinisphaera sp. SPP-AMP-43 TaxID=3121288 RepID=UPI003C6E2230
MRQHPAKTLALAACGCTALWAVQATAQTNGGQPSLDQLQQQIQQLQQQVQDLKTQQQAQPQGQDQGQAANTTSAQSANPETGAKQDNKKLTINGGVVAEYQVRDDHHSRNQRTGGDLILDYFDLGISGDAGNGITYGLDYRWSDVNFADDQMLHNGWAAYDFGAGDSSQVKGGFFQVPFGNLPFGYQSFWAPGRYYLGFADNQAAGLGYKYEANGWRLDIDAFKNDDLEQNTTYGGNPSNGYDQINGGNVRVGYTFKPEAGTVNVSGSVRGGQLETDSVSGGDAMGNRWAASAAVNASLGNWTLQGQYTDYRYNVADDSALSGDSVIFENYGYGYLAPASGQMFSASIGHTFPVELGPISSFSVYDDYDYLMVGGDGEYASQAGFEGASGDTQVNVVGAQMIAGPIYIWAEMISGKNAAMAFNGPNDDNWHHRFNLTAAYYFSGDLIQ